jgi:hypothetical protein
MILHVFYFDDFASFLHLITFFLFLISNPSFVIVGYRVYLFVYLIICIFICAELSVSASLALMMKLLPQRISGGPLA